MAAAQYIGVGGVAKKVKNQYFGAGGVARKVKTGHIGVAGVARKFYAGLDVKPTLADNDWATIAAVSEMGAASTYWSVGDEKDITLSTGETLTMAIMGFDHDDLASGGKAGITFGMKHLMNDTRKMSNSSSTSGGFNGTDMYTWLQETLHGQLPSDLRTVIQSVYKKTAAGNASTVIHTASMRLFLFSEVEICGLRTYSATGEGSQYSYFTQVANRVKKIQNGAGVAKPWWERSPHATNNILFCNINANGGQSNATTGYNHGVCFGFCV